jgi:ribulose 1,5-bisphosphate synthetase/thiazole synthase
MFLDRTAIAHGAILKADVCIVGGGAAGITLARTLAARP